MAPRKRPPLERFAEKTRQADSGCIEWTGHLAGGGYGRFWFEGKNALAHRWIYERCVGPIPDGLQLDHLCRVRHCVNPDHLEPVTASENVRRGLAPRAAAARGRSITHCPAGHPYTAENTYTNRGGRACLICKRSKARESYERNREITIERARQWRLANLERAREVARASTRRYREKKKAA